MQILTPSGFQKFDGLKRWWHEECLEFTFDDGTKLKTALNHRFIVYGKERLATQVVEGENIGKIVSKIVKLNEPQYFYDPLNVRNGSVFCHDKDLVSHNSFLGTGNTLFAPELLLGLKARSPLYRHNEVRVYKKPEEGHNYVMMVDVAQGRNQDYSTFTLIDTSVQPFQQVAAYRNNNISPLLFPDIIYKYAKTYNDAYVVVENNDQGVVVCNALYYDLEYENMFIESVTKSDAVGVKMTKRIKRIGCSHIKDIIEQGKLVVYDEDTIIEMSQFEAKGNSYEAADGCHDDMVMNLVLFGWFASTDFFQDMSNINFKSMLYNEQVKRAEEDLTPVGELDDSMKTIEQSMTDDVFGGGWSTVKDVFEN